MLTKHYDEDPHELDRRASLFIVSICLAAVLLILTAIIGPRISEAAPERDVVFSWNGDRNAREVQISAWVSKWFSKCSPKKRNRALSLVPEVVAASEAGNVNPAIVAAIVSLESTWNPEALGLLGEKGLMQVKDRPVPTTPLAQLEQGIEMLRASYAKCGTTFGAISYYGTGSTCRGYRGAELRIRLAREIETF